MNKLTPHRILRKLILIIFSIFFIFGCAGQMGPAHKRDMSRMQQPAFKPYQGVKKRIAVTKFENKVQGVPGSRLLGDGFAEMLTTQLIKTGRFVVIERQALNDIIAEQELGQTGLVRWETAARIGQVLGAQIIVRGVISEFAMRKSGGGGDIKIKGFTLGTKSSNAHVAVDIRMIDASTGQILYSHNASGTAVSTGLTFGYAEKDFDFTAGGFEKTPLGQATRQAIQDSVNFIVNKMQGQPFTAKVIKSKGSNIYINAGSLTNVKPGDRFLAYSKGEEFIDPDTGLSLGSEESLIGTVEVRDVKEKFSTARLVSGKGSLKRGDIIKSGVDIQTFNVPAEARSDFEYGKKLYGLKDYKGAEESYMHAVKASPEFALGYNELGNTLTWQNRWKDSVGHYRRAVRLKPDAAIFHKNLADALRNAGKPEEAKAEYEAVLQINPNDKKAREWTVLLPGDMLINKNDFKGAEIKFREAVKQLPGSYLAHNRLANSLFSQNRWAEAVPYYQKAVQLSPNDNVLHTNLANALKNTGKFQEAKTEYETALSLNPDDKRAREGMEYITKSERQKAVIQKIISLEEKSDTEVTKNAFQEGLKVIPDETLLLFELDKARAQKIRANTPRGQYGWLGINIMTFGSEERKKYLASNVTGVPDKDLRGMLVTDITAGSAAEEAGIQPVIRKQGVTGNNPVDFKKLGDIIIEIDGHPALGRLLSHLATKKPGETVILKLIRDGKPLTVSVTLKPRPG